MILEVVQSKWSLTWYDPLGPRMCVLELMNGHVLQILREQLKVPGSRQIDRHGQTDTDRQTETAFVAANRIASKQKARVPNLH